jgi:uncharacterized protein (TIGR03905 family)
MAELRRFTVSPSGVCSRKITVVLEGDWIKEVTYEGGCEGNLEAISRLVVGMNAREVAERLHGIGCGKKDTSCPDQLALALEEFLKE